MLRQKHCKLKIPTTKKKKKIVIIFDLKYYTL